MELTFAAHAIRSCVGFVVFCRSWLRTVADVVDGMVLSFNTCYDTGLPSL
jgi:hypothetical protein